MAGNSGRGQNALYKFCGPPSSDAYDMQALIDMAECTITCISFIMGVNLVCHEYGIITPSTRITSEI